MDESSFFFTTGISLLALIIAFYSVVLSTQRIPNFLTSIYVLIKYSLFYLIVGAVALILYQAVVKRFFEWSKEDLFYLQAGLFLLILFSLGYFLLKEYHKVFSLRRYYHVWENVTNLFPRQTDDQGNPDYLEERQIGEFCDAFLPSEKEKILALYRQRTSDSLSVYCGIGDRTELDKTLVRLACWALKEKLNLVYLSCGRHPYEFVELLKKELDKQPETGCWGNVKKQLLLVDAHTNHFGFKEFTYRQQTNYLKSDKVSVEVADWSYVGIHSAVAHGYKQIKKKDGKDKASLLIYDSCYALTDLESDKLYRIFLKHVVPSERSMGGNITVFAEQWLPAEIKGFVHTLVDVSIAPVLKS